MHFVYTGRRIYRFELNEAWQAIVNVSDWLHKSTKRRIIPIHLKYGKILDLRKNIRQEEQLN